MGIWQSHASEPACWFIICPGCLFIGIAIKGLLSWEKLRIVCWFGWGNRCSTDLFISSSSPARQKGSQQHMDESEGKLSVYQLVSGLDPSVVFWILLCSQWKKDFCSYKHVPVSSAPRVIPVLGMMSTHLALWNRALISALMWQMAAPQTLMLCKCVINWGFGISQPKKIQV